MREIPLFDELWDGLMAYRESQSEMFDAFGIPFNEKTHIFCMPTGKVYDPRTYEDLFKRTLKAAALPDINFHTLRHTFATRALEAGMDVKVLSTILGHAQASTTLNLYAHALPDHKRVSMEKCVASMVQLLTPTKMRMKNTKMQFDTNGKSGKNLPGLLPLVSATV